MSVTTHSPTKELERGRARFETLVSDLWKGPWLGSDTERLTLDLQETDATFVATAALPGYTPEEINVAFVATAALSRYTPEESTVEITGGVVSIRAEHTTEQEKRDGAWHLHERYTGTVVRAFTLPAPIRQDDARATLRDGVLTVTLPKTTATPSHKVPMQQQST